MPGEDQDEKTEDATPYRLQQAREEGQVAKSRDLVIAGVMLTGAVALWTIGPKLTTALMHGLRGTLSAPLPVSLTVDRLNAVHWDWFQLTFPPLLAFFGLIMLAVVVFHLIQFGLLFVTKPLVPNIGRLNPISGLQRLFSLPAVGRLVFSVLKIGIVMALATWVLWQTLPSLAEWQTLSPVLIAAELGWLTVKLSLIIASVLLALAMMDWMFQRMQFARQMRMTKQQIRDELKQQMGDPLMRQRQRDAHQKIADAENVRAVETADVLMTNPTHYSVGIKYDPQTHAAPVVVAKGEDELALFMREVAKQHGVPIIERKALARALYHDVEVGQPIPVGMYEAFVEIMMYVYRVTGKKFPTA